MPNTLRHLPAVTYQGLTIILSNKSRFDKLKLLSGNGGYMFCEEILYPLGINRYQCDIRLSEDKSPLLTGTKAVLCLGQRAMKEWMGDEVANNTLNEFRGSPLKKDGIVWMASYTPQDAVDKQNHEARLNPELMDWAEAEAKEKEDRNPVAAKKRRAITLRSNFRFWLRHDTAKLIRILQDYEGNIPEQESACYHIYPPINDAIACLASHRDSFLYFDMETLFEPPYKMTCFSFGFNLKEIYVIPIVNHHYEFAYEPLHLCWLMRSLQMAIQRNCLVAHNGAGFDFVVLMLYYRLCLGENLYDTMVAHHRCFPEVEKSLGHCGSLCTYETYHKDEAGYAFGSAASAQALWEYCGKDVSLMMRIHRWQQDYAAKTPGLTNSIQQAMDSIRPYSINTLQGITYDEQGVIRQMAENDKLMMQYLRIIRLLVGEEVWTTLKRKSKKPMPNSNTQCCAYFHDMLGYSVVGKSKKTGKPSLDEKNLLKLKLKEENPVIDFCLAYRRLSKETGSLKFIPWPGVGKI